MKKHAIFHYDFCCLLLFASETCIATKQKKNDYEESKQKCKMMQSGIKPENVPAYCNAIEILERKNIEHDKRKS